MRAMPTIAALMQYVQRARTHAWSPPPEHLIVKPGPGQESVWDFPRPPIVQDVQERIQVIIGGITVADTMKGLRICETAGAPCYYIPPEDIRMDLLHANDNWSVCEWKGVATSFDIKIPSDTGKEKVIRDIAWSYLEPLTDLDMGYERAAGYLAFYAGKADACYIGEEKVTPQPGGYYGGWVRTNLVGPIKGERGTEGW